MRPCRECNGRGSVVVTQTKLISCPKCGSDPMGWRQRLLEMRDSDSPEYYDRDGLAYKYIATMPDPLYWQVLNTRLLVVQIRYKGDFKGQ